MSNYIITTARLGLRMWEAKDIVPYFAMSSDSEVMAYFPSILDLQETEASVARIQAHFEQHRFGVYVVELLDTKEFIGFTGLMVPTFESFFTPCVEIGWRFKKGAWGKGFATEAAFACLGYGFETLCLDSIYSFTSIHNIRSEKVMQRIGMKKICEFDHPKIDIGHYLCKHAVYTIDKTMMKDQ